MAEVLCQHLREVHEVKPKSNHGCEECLKRGDTWVHLRLCMECGNVGCCDDSKNKHASNHVRVSAHPVVRSFEPGERWLYCYPDDMFFDPD